MNIKSFFGSIVLGNLRQQIWKNLRLCHQLKSGLNIEVKSRAEWSIYNEIFVSGEYDLAIEKAIELLPNNRELNVLDLGANIGYFTLRVADLVLNNKPQPIPFNVTLVEGSPFVYKELKNRLDRELILTDQIEIVNGLVGERQGSSEIFVSDFHVSNSIYMPHPSSKPHSIDVPYVDLNTLYKDKEHDSIDLLKCDIEGSELSFIENYGNLLAKVKLAVFEFHHHICDTQKCFNLLRENFTNHRKLQEDATGLTSLEMFWK